MKPTTSFFAAALICVSPLFADQAHSIYAGISERMLAGERVVEQGPYVFSLGTARPTSEQSISYRVAMGKARARALDGFFDIARKRVDWPAEISEPLGKVLFEQYKVLKSPELTLNGTQTIDQGDLDREVVYCVLVTPRDQTSLAPPDFDGILAVLDAAFNNHDQRLDSLAYHEICARESIPDVTGQMAQQLGRRYGGQISAIINLGPVAELGPAWSQGIEFDPGELAELAIGDLISLLARKPFDPVISSALAVRLKGKGYRRGAELFCRIAQVWPAPSAVSPECGELAPVTQTEKSGVQVDQLLASKIRSRWEAWAPRSELGVVSQLIINGLGQVPVIDSIHKSELTALGDVAFRSAPPRIPEALRYYALSLDEAISADTCSLVGRCLEMLEEPLLAIPFLRQALLMNAQHQYAGVNLAVVLHLAGEHDLACRVAKEAETNPLQTDWGRERLRSLNLID